MRPLILPPLKVTKSAVPASVLKDAHDEHPGCIEGLACSPKEFVFPRLAKHLNKHGYVHAKRSRYANFSYTYIRGAASWHTDPGFGMVAAWMVHLTHLTFTDPQLVTKHGAVDMGLGTVVVFNSNLGHAWVSNEVCVLAMVTVRRKRGVAP